VETSKAKLSGRGLSLPKDEESSFALRFPFAAEASGVEMSGVQGSARDAVKDRRELLEPREVGTKPLEPGTPLKLEPFGVNVSLVAPKCDGVRQCRLAS
jgi:hypothetical protein